MRNLRNASRGAMDPLVIPLIIAVFVIIGLAGFGIWSFVQLGDAKTTEQAEIDEAVAEATEAQKQELELEFAEREKEPYRTYRSPSFTGSIEITYPKTWSAYTEEKENASVPLNATFHPDYVKHEGSDTNDALRVVLDSSEYTSEVSRYRRFIEKNEAKATAITISGVTGTRIDGKISENITDAVLVIVPLRDKTLRVYTETRTFKDDFENIILKNISFIP